MKNQEHENKAFRSMRSALMLSLLAASVFFFAGCLVVWLENGAASVSATVLFILSVLAALGGVLTLAVIIIREFLHNDE